MEFNNRNLVSNYPLEDLKRAIESDDEPVALILLKRYESESIEIKDIVAPKSDLYHYLESCVCEEDEPVLCVYEVVETAFAKRMFEFVECLVSTCRRHAVHRSICEYWEEYRNKNGGSVGLPTSFVSIARNLYADMVFERNPLMMPLLIGQLQLQKFPEYEPDALHSVLLQGDILRHIMSFAFKFDIPELIEYSKTKYRRRCKGCYREFDEYWV